MRGEGSRADAIVYPVRFVDRRTPGRSRRVWVVGVVALPFALAMAGSVAGRFGGLAALVAVVQATAWLARRAAGTHDEPAP